MAEGWRHRTKAETLGCICCQKSLYHMVLLKSYGLEDAIIFCLKGKYQHKTITLKMEALSEKNCTCVMFKVLTFPFSFQCFI